MKILKKSLLSICLFLTVTLCSGIDLLASEEDTINKGVTINEVDVSGKTGEEAKQEFEAYFKEVSQKKISFQIGTNTVEVTPAELGVTWENQDIFTEAAGLGNSGNVIQKYKSCKDIEVEGVNYELKYSFNKDTIVAVLNEKCLDYDTEAVNAAIERVDGVFYVTDSAQGIALNVEESANTIYTSLTEKWDKKELMIPLVYNSTEPDVTGDGLREIQDVIGTYTTTYSSSSAGRVTNLYTGSDKLDGIVLYQGQELSVSNMLEPFTVDNGYDYGGAYENGTVVQSLGGGVCQLSTTLYNAVLLAELNVVERHNHTMRVSYVDQSADAAIAEGLMDFRFVNSTETPIYIEASVGGGYLTFTIYGKETRPADRQISFYSEVTGTTEAGVELKATSAPVGTITGPTQNAHNGSTARLWKTVTENGVSTTTQVNSSTYYTSPAIYEVGVSSGNADISAQMQAAVASNNLDAVNAVIATANAQADAAAAAQAQADADAAAAAQAQADAEAAAAAQAQADAEAAAQAQADSEAAARAQSEASGGETAAP